VEKSFEALNISPPLLNALSDLNFMDPTFIQARVIPKIRGGQDLIGIAPTGTGKTAAYLIPILMKLKYPQQNNPRALILVPTRELAIQVKNMTLDLSKYMDLKAVAIFGGTGIKKQIKELITNPDILIATPGRLIDIYRLGEIHLKNINTLVLDEADRMMDMGFLPQLHRILEMFHRKKRQNLLFSATFPKKVERLSENFLEFPERIEISPSGSTAESVDQYFYRVPNLKTKINLLHFLLANRKSFTRVFIFTKTKETANNVFKYIRRKIDPKVRVIHANKDQNARINAINAFREGEIRILVSTDLSARGIDISRVSQVINFDVPMVYEDYVHRIGRTGRASASGESITFVNKPDEYHLENIEKLIRQKIIEKNIPTEVEITPTESSEQKKMELEIDRIKRRMDTEYKGAFHRKGVKTRKSSR
jgi:ATP-dependent RNA helicase RhlE